MEKTSRKTGLSSGERKIFPRDCKVHPDRTHNWPDAPKVTIGYDAIMKFIDKRWEQRDGKDDPYLRGTMHLFDDGLGMNNIGQWDRPRGGNVTTLIVDQEDMFYGSTKES